MNEIIHGGCLDHLEFCDCIFADPPDNLGLDYDGYYDKMPDRDYEDWLEACIFAFCDAAPVVWLSFNPRHILTVAAIASRIQTHQVKPCVQTFTFGQHNKHDFGNSHRALWRFESKGAYRYMDAVRIPSSRQLTGDKRADPRGRVPGDVFTFPRVTGNSRQRRSWHPTQLHEGLVQRCLLSCTRPDDYVIDPFGGTGTVLRVCKRINRRCRTIEISPSYVHALRAEHIECK